MKQPLNEFSIIAKYNQKMSQKRLVLDRKYSKMINLRKEKLEARKQREIEKFERKWKKAMERELYNLTHKRQKKEPKDKSVAKVKKEALRLVQRYAKLKRAVWSTEWPMIFLVDKMKWVMLDRNVHWGHCYWQKNHPWLAFDLENIRPIHYITNRTQNDQDAERIKNLPKETQDYLNEKKEDKTAKRKDRDRRFYEEIIEQYKPLVEAEEIRLWINIISQNKENGI